MRWMHLSERTKRSAVVRIAVHEAIIQKPKESCIEQIMHNAIQFPTGHRSSQLTLRCHNSSIEFGESSSSEDQNDTHLLHRHMGSCTTLLSLEGGRDSSFGSVAP